ncbi:hypothetical protein Ppb6_02968 [Photorhabdus australis subsp. thailandensis]|uniref:Uncharacterized protein n=1 Tax=Photorhabdus australis subsp. thailandensis TaxID=2805096 RepID=A0A1C0U1S4_9GAMM|nr:hypothetical protein [Photorhabdus australis]OCQ51853.1 hypothetical protein Ppb6_02968 [Photorhabdus australis subsp. thailandensis]
MVLTGLEPLVNGVVREGGLNCTAEETFPLAEALYQIWLSASLMGKITQSSTPLQSALVTTKRLLDAYKDKNTSRRYHYFISVFYS